MKSLITSVLLSTCLLLVPTAKATVLVAMNVEDLAANSPVVVVADVNHVRMDYNPAKTKIYTRVLITPTEVMRGEVVGTIELKLLGGQVDDVVARMPGAPNFEAGERVLIFLEPREDGDGYLVVGMFQGKLTVYKDPQTGLQMVQEPQLSKGVSLVDTAPAPSQPRTLKLASVRELVGQGGVK